MDKEAERELRELWGNERFELWHKINKEDTPESFEMFYKAIFVRPIPHHAYFEWIIPLYLVREEFEQREKYLKQLKAYWDYWKLPVPEISTDMIGTVDEAFRGSTKTTTLTIAWTAYRIGKEPHNSNMILRVGDDSAKDSAKEIATIIDTNEGWKDAFPFVRPDPNPSLGWGAAGYEVMRTDMPYDQWRQMCTATKGQDSTFVGFGYKSRAVIGKHPTGALVIDDIHDENNTASDRELQNVINVVKGTILPTISPKTWVTFVGTPWTTTDVLAYLKSTGRFYSAVTPALRNDKPTWDEVFHEKKVQELREVTGDIEFARMYLCDVTAMEGVNLKREWLHEYPAEKIQPDWPVLMGVDYASATDGQKGEKRDFFTIAVGRAIPGGSGVVLVDGFRAQLTQGEAELRLKEFWERYPTTQVIGVESVGKGEEFYNLLLRTSRMPIKAVSPGRRNKPHRFEIQMAPLFQWNRAWITDVPNEFIKHFKQEWVQFPFGEHDDTLDAVYWLLYIGMPHMFGVKFEPGVHDPYQVFEGEREKAPNPWTGLQRI